MIKWLEDAVMLTDDLEDGNTGYLIERALDEARCQMFRPPAAIGVAKHGQPTTVDPSVHLGAHPAPPETLHQPHPVKFRYQMRGSRQRTVVSASGSLRSHSATNDSNK